MISGKCVYLLLLSLTISTFSVSYTLSNRGRKLFGGYKIVPKICQPQNSSPMKSEQPAICMFNYECTRRNGQVVGACMDGFLFGACCQLPLKQVGLDNLEKVEGPDDLLSVYELDHVPDIPILLNPDGTPMTTSSSFGAWSSTKAGSPLNSVSGPFTRMPATALPDGSSILNTKDSSENAERPQIGQVNYNDLENNFSNLLGQQQFLNDLRLPSLLTDSDSVNYNKDHQVHSSIPKPVTTLLRPNQVFQIADPVNQLPSLFSQSVPPRNDTGPDTILLSKNGTTLQESQNPDEIFRPETSTKNVISGQTTASITKVTTKTPIFTQQYAYTDKLNGITPGTRPVNSFITFKKPLGGTRIDMKSTISKFATTTPMSYAETESQEGLVKVPTITYDAGNKKNDELDREEIAINHIISILNDSAPNSGNKFTKPQDVNTASSIPTWISIDKTSVPSVQKTSPTRPASIITLQSFPYTYVRPLQLSSHRLSTESPTTTSLISSSVSGGSTAFISSRLPVHISGTFQSSSSSIRPTTNPPAPTVIVLGPLGTEYKTPTTQKPSTRWPIPIITKPTIMKNSEPNTTKPLLSTTITHNISTVISGSTINNKHVLSTSYISVNLKDTPTSVKPSNNNSGINTNSVLLSSVTKSPPIVWTTISSWNNNKPSFHLKPSSPNFSWPKEPDHIGDKNVSRVPSTSTSPCEEETAVPDDSIIFPPVRHPELNISNAHIQQEKPTIVIKGNETDYPENFIVGDIPTPSFIEDDVLKNKVDSFVNKIVDSLQGNFEDLKDVVYTKRNSTYLSTSTQTSPGNNKPASASTKRPKPASMTTKSTVVTKKPTVVVRPLTSVNGKLTTIKPKPVSGQTVITKKPFITTKRPKPTKQPVVSSTETTVSEIELETTTPTVEDTTRLPEVVGSTDFRKVCGIRPLVKTGRIVGGKGAVFGEWPWQVLVREATWLGLFTKNKCGGVLITDRYVITAAHCQPGFLASLVAVFGEHDISGELESKRSVTRNVRRVIVNKGYDPATFENDLALLELESPIQFDAHIVPICMPEDNADFTGRMATVTGWGRLKYNGGVPSVLQIVHVPIMENSVCQEMFQTAGHSKLILDSFLCAGYANGQKDSCEGDSGGPLTIQRPDGRWTLVGTVSHGIKCAAPYLPGVYMRTTYFKPWLETITGV